MIFKSVPNIISAITISNSLIHSVVRASKGQNATVISDSHSQALHSLAAKRLVRDTADMRNVTALKTKMATKLPWIW